MKYYEEFKSYGDTFAERTNPDEFSSAIGRIAINFAELEDQLSKAIASLIGSQYDIGGIVTAELSFRAKVNLFASLVRQRAADRSFNVDNTHILEVLKELCTNVFKAEELRNTIMHSSWLRPYLRDAKAIRKKVTAKSRSGFRVIKEEVDSAYLLDIADFIICVAVNVEEFMM